MKQSDKRGPRHKPHDPERLRRHVPWAQTLIEHRRTSPAPPPRCACGRAKFGVHAEGCPLYAATVATLVASAELGESSTLPAPAADLEEEFEP